MPEKSLDLTSKTKQKAIKAKVEAEILKKAALADFEVFRRHYLGTESYRCQLEWVDLVEKYDEVLELCPGGHGKSMTAYQWVTWKIVQNRFMEVCGAAIGELNVAFISASANLGEKWLRQIAAYLESPKIVRDFGVFKSSKKWTTDAIIVKSPNPTAKVDHPTVTAVGIGGQVFGPRVHILIYDDIADKENSGTPEARKKLWETFHEGPFCWRRPGGKRWGIGTRMHSQDLYSRKIKQAGKLVRDDGLTKIYKSKDIVVRVDRAVNFDTGQILAPENKEYTMEFFEREKAGMGSASFARRYLNVAADEADTVIERSWVEQCFTPSLSFGDRPKDLRVVVAVDPAVGVSKGSSKLGLIVWGFSEKERDRRWVLDYVYAHVRSDAQAELIMGKYLFFDAEAVVIERNACQRYLKDAVVAHGKELGVIPYVEMPFTGSNKTDELVGVQRLAPLYEYGRVFVPYAEGSVKKAEDFADGVSASNITNATDITMANWFAEEYAAKRLRGGARLIRRTDVPWFMRNVG